MSSSLSLPPHRKRARARTTAPDPRFLSLVSSRVPGQCIAEAFGVDLDKADDQRAYSIAPQTLSSLLDQHAATVSLIPLPPLHEIGGAAH